MTIALFANDAVTTLSSGISAVATSVNVANGALFPSPGVGEYFVVTFRSATNPTLKEIAWCTGRSGNTLTIIRAQEGTAAAAWSGGDIIGNFFTAGQMSMLLQQGQQQAQAPNYAADSGAANAYVAAYSPVVSAHTVGMPLRIKIANTNTGAATFNPGPGVKNIVQQNGQPVQAGQLVAGGIYEMVYDGTSYQATLTNVVAVTSTSGSDTFTVVYYPGGWCRQMGRKVSATPNSATAIAFPVAFGSTPAPGNYGCSVQKPAFQVSNVMLPEVIGDPTTTGMNVYYHDVNVGVANNFTWWIEGQL